MRSKMSFFEFLRKANSEDNGNPSQRRLVVFYAVFLFSTAITIAYINVCFAYPQYIMEFTIALLGWILTALGIGVVAKGKEQKVSADDLMDMRNQEANIEVTQKPVESEKG